MIRMRVKVRIPRRLERFLDPAKTRRELKVAVDRTANVVRTDFRETTLTWRRPLRFRKTMARDYVTNIKSTVFTTSKIYYFVEKGTYPHPIVARRASLLKFRTGYRAKTRVRTIGSFPGGKFGPFTYRRWVMHPGFRGRAFSGTIARKRRKYLRNQARLALLRSIRFGGIR